MSNTTKTTTISSSLVSAMAAIVIMTSLLAPVASHGRLWTPPGRATMWRKGFKTPANYNDNQMFCGGLSHQQSLGYKCGLCGDPYDSDLPHEAGGKFATGTIAANYTQGQTVTLEVDLTANHKGWFEFKLCPTNDYKKKATQACLDLYPLALLDVSGTKLDVTSLGSNMIKIRARLPKDLSCDLCMLQWHYHGGNNWGTGYTLQEEFYGCADVRIAPAANTGSKLGDTKTVDAKISPTTTTTTISPDIFKMTNRSSSNDRKPASTPDTPNGHTKTATETKTKITNNNNMKTNSTKTMRRHCVAAMSVPGLDLWCERNCVKGGACPTSHCTCDTAATDTPPSNL